MVRLAELEHHVVGDVDDAVDGPHPERDQPVLDPLRRGAHGDVAQHSGQEAAAQGRVDDLDRARWRRASSVARRGSRGTRTARRGRGQIAGNAGNRHGVGPVGVDLEVPQDVAFDAEDVGDAVPSSARRQCR